jgi:hypothetical protein
MNLLNVAVGALTSANSPLAGSPVASILLGSTSGTAAAPARDSLISDLPDVSSTVNLLGQFASSQSSGVSVATDLLGQLTGSQASGTSTDGSQEPELTLPPLPPMPAPQKPAAVPTDDHGQSNVVFSDSDSDGALIH